jgi:hypothetical protein
VRASTPEFARPGSLLEWAWALDLLSSVRNAWLSTVTAAGRPHSAPVWVVVVDGRLWFWTPRSSAKGRNLLRASSASLHAERGDDVVVVEGTAALCEPPRAVVEAYAEKYGAELALEESWLLEVESALAWQGHLGANQQNATRFVVDQ